MPEECKLLSNLLILIFCFLASITAAISSGVPSPGKERHHILLFSTNRFILNDIRIYLSLSELAQMDVLILEAVHSILLKQTVFNALSSSSALPITIS